MTHFETEPFLVRTPSFKMKHEAAIDHRAVTVRTLNQYHDTESAGPNESVHSFCIIEYQASLEKKQSERSNAKSEPCCHANNSRDHSVRSGWLMSQTRIYHKIGSEECDQQFSASKIQPDDDTHEISQFRVSVTNANDLDSDDEPFVEDEFLARRKGTHRTPFKELDPKLVTRSEVLQRLNATNDQADENLNNLEWIISRLKMYKKAVEGD